jgi:hypothetical protein
MTSNNDQRPPVWVGHVYLSVKDVRSAARWLETVGLRPIVVRNEAAVLELRGGTYVVVRQAPSDGGTAPFDLMVDDIDAAHRGYGENGLSPTPIHRGSARARFDHDTFELLAPTVGSSPSIHRMLAIGLCDADSRLVSRSFRRPSSGGRELTKQTNSADRSPR